MLRHFLPVLTLAVLFGAAAPATAGDFFASIVRDFKRNHMWPEPFVHADRAAVAIPIGIEVANGWRKQTLLCSYHFKEDSAQLTQAGELKLHWILTQVPPQRRVVFIQRATFADVTAARVDAVQQTAVRMQPAGGMPQIVESDTPMEGWPAEQVNNLFINVEKSRPAPILPKPQDGTGSSP